MNFRRAVPGDLDGVAAIYSRIHDEEEAGRSCIGWVRQIYPTRATAEAALRQDELFVAESGGQLIAAARINQAQVPEYRKAAWTRQAPDARVMVLHTLVVSPDFKGRGCGTQFVAFYENYARAHGCTDLRMDTNVRNMAARALYRKLGYCEVSVVPCCFNGIADVQLVCLEKHL